MTFPSLITYTTLSTLLIPAKYRTSVKYEHFYRITDDKVLSSSLVDHRRATRIWDLIPCRDIEVRFYSQTLNCEVF